MPRIMRSHQVIMRVSFDKPCSSVFALAAVKDCMHGDFYPTETGERSCPGMFTVKAITRLPKRYAESRSIA